MTSWRLGGVSLWEALGTVFGHRYGKWPTPGSTRTAGRTTSPVTAEASTSSKANVGGSPVTAATDVGVVTQWSTRPMTVDDVLNAPLVVGGTIEHATSLLESIAEALSDEAELLRVGISEEAFMALVFLTAETLDARDELAEIAR